MNVNTEYHKEMVGFLKEDKKLYENLFLLASGGLGGLLLGLKFYKWEYQHWLVAINIVVIVSIGVKIRNINREILKNIEKLKL